MGIRSSNWPVARAVAASSCFALQTNALKLNPRSFTGGLATGSDRTRLVSHIGVSDGGV